MPASGERFCADFSVGEPLRAFDRLPVGEHLLRAAHLHITEHVRMASDELVHDAGDHVGQTEAPFFGRDLRQQRDLQQQVAQLLGHFPGIVRVQRVEQLVSFFQDGGAHLGPGELAIPRAAVRRAQPGNHVLQRGELARVRERCESTGRRRGRSRRDTVNSPRVNSCRPASSSSAHGCDGG